MGSLLDILKKEDELIAQIKRHKRACVIIQDEMVQVQNIDIDCECKRDDLKRLAEQLEDTQKLIVSDEKQLVGVRKQMRKYLFKLILRNCGSE